MKQLLLTVWMLCFTAILAAQNKKAIDHADVHRWKKIEQSSISNDGKWVVWVQNPVTQGDATLHLWNAATGTTEVLPRASEPRFSEDNHWLFFRIKPALDSLKTLRRKKVKEDDLPKDTLGVYHLPSGKLEKVARVRNFNVPDKWSNWLFFQIEAEKSAPAVKDTTKTVKNDSIKVNNKPAPKNGKKIKKEDKENGFRLIVRNLSTGKQDTFAFVKDYVLSKKGRQVLFSTTGKGDSISFACNKQAWQNGVYHFDCERNQVRPVWRGKGKFSQLSFDEPGRQAAFLLDADTTKARIRPWQLCYYATSGDSARAIAGAQSTWVDQPGFLVSEYAKPVFSEDGSKLYFGIAPPPVLNDTTLLPEEIVQVEVWAWTEKRIYTQQEVQMETEKKRSYPVVWHTQKNKFVQLGSPEIPEIRYQDQRNSNLAIGFTEEPYAQAISWDGVAHKDLYVIDQLTGEKKLITGNLRGNPRISPSGKYVAWWSDPDTAWFAWNANTKQIKQLTDNRTVAFYDEENDVPDYPDAHGLAGWFDQDEGMIVYDKYDLWNIDPTGKRKPVRLTKGRESGMIYRYIRLDPESRSISPSDTILLHQTQERTRFEGYSWLEIKKDTLHPWLLGNMVYSKTPQQARDANPIVFTRENFETFPDLQYVSSIYHRRTPDVLKSLTRISQANPQQSEYNWGSIETVEWTSLTGEKLKGLLVKPAGFDPSKQYPMIVNFYERLSEGIFQHRTPDFHRSQINYAVYASKGYLIFAPDIPYRIGYPGESAYNAIVSGVTALMNKGFVDPKRVALQGHSWGGYQSAYLITKTDLFVCAESGAPVVNMPSAYGGIRWESGMSRAFQYEHSQSRIGGSLWEYPMRFIENSPLFSMDKVNTPVLILHNDKDGAVPWYQGIEMYSALRRLGKPAWLLNYNDEPHWPVKLQNRIDFQTRMMQFFDHYLMKAPMPRWMQRGVPPLEKGILQGLEDGE
ncbi:MAG: S9 family peptidase [Saprospiraceae bacterium]|nr:S9 family peptidase [Saprospiraceae bacterium]